MKKSCAMATVATKCQNCGTEFQTDYQRLGAPVVCQNCLQDTVPIIPNGTQISRHDSDLTYNDFRQLVGYSAYRGNIAPLFDRWFGYQLAGDGLDTLIVNKANEAIDPLWLHLKIQSDADKQHQLYQAAMALWR